MGPIGVFDSGVGGLSVVREIRALLPAEDVVYVADHAHCPYGDRPSEEVCERALAIGRHLQAEGARLVVAACNTASGAALEALRATLTIPVVGLEPAVKTGVGLTRVGRIGVMATSGTLRSPRYSRLIDAYASGVQVVAQACPGLADLVESGTDDGLTERMQEWTAPLREAGVDTVVLGCTHYPFVREAIARAMGEGVTLVDSAPAIARRVAHLLGAPTPAAGPGPAAPPGSLRVLTTGSAERVRPVVRRLVGGDVPVEHTPI